MRGLKGLNGNCSRFPYFFIGTLGLLGITIKQMGLEMVFGQNLGWEIVFIPTHPLSGPSIMLGNERGEKKKSKT